MVKIVFATGNQHKLREIRQILSDLPCELISMKDAGIDVEIDENGTTFEENALIKARTVAEHTDEIVMADDSGLEIDWLGGEPGIKSARFLGEDTPHEIKNRALIEKLEGVPDEKRTARFVCAVAAILPDKTELVVRETFEGRIAHEPEGLNGFGYDPIFYVPECGCTSAVLSPEKKNELSHRGKAFREMAQKLKKLLK
jgi:XTP/dITP diphosphohydrolase